MIKLEQYFLELTDKELASLTKDNYSMFHIVRLKPHETFICMSLINVLRSEIEFRINDHIFKKLAHLGTALVYCMNKKAKCRYVTDKLKLQYFRTADLWGCHRAMAKHLENKRRLTYTACLLYALETLVALRESTPIHDARIKSIADVYSLDKNAMRVLDTLCWNYEIYGFREYALNHTPDSKLGDINNRRFWELTLILDLPVSVLEQIFFGKNGLHTQGLVVAKNYDTLYINNWVSSFISSIDFSQRNIFDFIMTRMPAQDTLPIGEFGKECDVGHILSMIRNHGNDTPLHILLYGAEGCGKTSLAKSIASELGVHVYAPRNMTARPDDDFDVVIKKEYTDFAVLQILRHAKSLSGSIVLLDEAEMVLAQGKDTVNRALDEICIPCIWIVNSISGMQPSTLRRFAYSIKFDKPDSAFRERIWSAAISKHGKSDIYPPERVARLANEYDVPPSCVEMAIRHEGATCRMLTEDMLSRYARLMHIHTGNGADTMSPSYDIGTVNAEGVEYLLFAARGYADRLRQAGKGGAFTAVFYGPPGTGKTELAKHIARMTGLKFKPVRYSDISDKYVGETEKNIRDVFDTANESGGLLFIDEADSLLSSREGAVRSWEVTQVNEMLVNLENAKCMVICATNFQGHLDHASMRRFHHQIKFDYLRKSDIPKIADSFFRIEGAKWKTLSEYSTIAHGDFYAVYKRLEWLPAEERTEQRITAELVSMLDGKKDGKHMGFLR